MSELNIAINRYGGVWFVDWGKGSANSDWFFCAMWRAWRRSKATYMPTVITRKSRR